MGKIISRFSLGKTGACRVATSRNKKKIGRAKVRRSSKFLMGVSAAAMLMASGAPVMAQDSDDEAIEEVVVLGSRSTKPRSAADSPVPVDVLSGEQFNAFGNAVDITDSLKALVPSYTATPATGDGSAFVRPTSLRGMAPDQTLVLVNGKRRHRSALVHFFAPAAGNGAHGSDIGMIPSIALKRVEVLRDGAAAQYGSDAIAGVINFVIKDANNGGDVIAQYGQFYQGEQSYKISANAGFPIGDTGFVNISAEYVDNDALSRGIQREANAAELIALGVTDFGADTPFGDEPFLQSWGRPETSGSRFFINSGVEVSESAQVYLHGNYAETDGRYRFFYRTYDHPTILALQEIDPTFEIPTGYTPFLDGAQTDLSIVGGVKGDFDSGLVYDFSVAYGKNTIDYFLNNTLNPSLGLVGGLPPQRDFDIGRYEQKEVNINADFSMPVGDNLNVAFGGEWREETYVIIAGEPNSFAGEGSNGLPGFSTDDAGSFSRSNFGAYVDVEQDISEAFLMQYALRYEDFSDFGGTINGKIAGRYKISDGITVRGAVSTGFHAPTPGQSNASTTIVTFDGVTGDQTNELLRPSTSPDALAAGGAPLKEEKSLSFSGGFSADLGENATLTVDAYHIDVDDRIYRTGDIPVVGSLTGDTISFYTNALDMRHTGIDVVLSSSFDWSDGASTDLSLAANINKAKVRGQTAVVTPAGDTIDPVSLSTIEDIENNYPNFRFVLTANTHFMEKWNLMARANYYGSHYDERGTIDPDIGSGLTAKIGAVVYIDLELGYQINDSLRVVAGGSNVLDSFVDEIGLSNDNRLSVGLQYPRRSAANYEGGSWYVRARYSF
jgi:iron complex outermembrane receptor protein